MTENGPDADFVESVLAAGAKTYEVLPARIKDKVNLESFMLGFELAMRGVERSFARAAVDVRVHAGERRT